MQIYENLFRDDAHQKNDRGELRFDSEGNVIEDQNERGIEDSPSMAAALKPLLQYMDGYRRTVAAPENTLVRKKYSKYADLSYIKDRLGAVEDGIHKAIFSNNQVTVDYQNGDYDL